MLLEFNLLQRAYCEDISSMPWATPASRLALDQYFKVKQAHVEIECLNIEIQHLVTSICDKLDQYLWSVEGELQASDPILAFHVKQYRRWRTRFDSTHLTRLSKLSNLPGFTGSLLPGSAINPYGGDSRLSPVAEKVLDSGSCLIGDEESETDDEEDAAAGEQVLGIIVASTDSTVRRLCSR